jgi:thiamine biosynthesis protein ThiS
MLFGPTSDTLEEQVVTIQLNGELREVPEGLNVAELMEWLKLPHDRVAVERNLEIVPRAHWDVTLIQAGDRLEVVHLVGGGFSGWLETAAGRPN